LSFRIPLGLGHTLSGSNLAPLAIISPGGAEKEGIVNSFDLSILSFLNQFAHRSNTFDQAVVLLSDANLLKGVVIVGLMWWVWFERQDTQRKREAVLAALIVSVPALVVAKILTRVMMRPRPLVDERLQSVLHYGIDNTNWRQVSSFPSDHAVLFFAMATGIFLPRGGLDGSPFFMSRRSFACPVSISECTIRRISWQGRPLECSRSGWPTGRACESQSRVGRCG